VAWSSSGSLSILGALPHLIEGLEASRKYLELKGKKDQATHEVDKP
jgi:hypothetical protein